jgi:hypothetical protein
MVGAERNGRRQQRDRSRPPSRLLRFRALRRCQLPKSRVRGQTVGKARFWPVAGACERQQSASNANDGLYASGSKASVPAVAIAVTGCRKSSCGVAVIDCLG